MKVKGKEQKMGRCVPETREQQCMAKQTIEEGTLSLPRERARGRGHVGVQFSLCMHTEYTCECTCQWHVTNIHVTSIYVKGYVLNKCSLTNLSRGGGNTFLQE